MAERVVAERTFVVYELEISEGRVHGETIYSLNCSYKGISKTKGMFRKVVEDFPMSDIVRVDCFRSDETVNGMASGAAAGFLVGGAAGAVVGGMLNSGAKEWWIEIELNDQSVHYFRLHNGDHYGKQFLKWAKAHNIKIEACRPTEKLTASENISAADEILKYKQLLDQGVLTQDEFDTKKKQLLGI